MKKRRSQIAMEYLMITGFALLIAVPAFYFFREYTQSSNEKIVSNRLNQIANDILVAAAEMHYYGAPSKTVLTVEMPPSIKNMGVITDNNEWQLVFTVYTSTGGTTQLYYNSDVPITPTDASPLPTTGCNADLHAQCGISLDCYCFPEKDFSEGIKNIKMEAHVGTVALSCIGGVSNCVIIDEVSDELSS